jgi:hypothetical protein
MAGHPPESQSAALNGSTNTLVVPNFINNARSRSPASTPPTHSLKSPEQSPPPSRSPIPSPGLLTNRLRDPSSAGTSSFTPHAKKCTVQYINDRWPSEITHQPEGSSPQQDVTSPVHQTTCRTPPFPPSRVPGFRPPDHHKPKPLILARQQTSHATATASQ